MFRIYGYVPPIIVIEGNVYITNYHFKDESVQEHELVYETSRLKNNTLLLLINYSSYVGGWGNVLAMSCSFVLIVLNSSTDSLDVLRYKIIM